eukprot:TRINITY_DN7953_c0_g1_i4.p1 TRINITY_DN7953_c0_g1~~TRINITY_DN7953_c0_g1_i4.p1  ORF type:complete len:346 (-),score=-46.29 TRINITY_DN7953_c0_g1_i4:388-1425(-)
MIQLVTTFILIHFKCQIVDQKTNLLTYSHLSSSTFNIIPSFIYIYTIIITIINSTIQYYTYYYNHNIKLYYLDLFHQKQTQQQVQGNVCIKYTKTLSQYKTTRYILCFIIIIIQYSYNQDEKNQLFILLIICIYTNKQLISCAIILKKKNQLIICLIDDGVPTNKVRITINFHAKHQQTKKQAKLPTPTFSSHKPFKEDSKQQVNKQNCSNKIVVKLQQSLYFPSKLSVFYYNLGLIFSNTSYTSQFIRNFNLQVADNQREGGYFQHSLGAINTLKKIIRASTQGSLNRSDLTKNSLPFKLQHVQHDNIVIIAHHTQPHIFTICTQYDIIRSCIYLLGTITYDTL